MKLIAKVNSKISASLLFVLLALPLSANAQTDPAQAATALFDEFLELMTKVEIDSVIGLFAEDALFWGTGSQTLVEDPAGVDAYFSALRGNPPGQTVASKRNASALVISDSLVLVSGMWLVTPKGQTEGTPLRVSLAVALRNGEWKIVQFHNSAVPG